MDFKKTTIGAAPKYISRPDKVSAQDRALVQVLYQQAKWPLDFDLNLDQHIVNSRLGEVVRRIWTSGFTKPFSITYGTPTDTVVVPDVTVTVGGEAARVANPSTTSKRNEIALGAPPGTGTRTDFVFLEFWMEEVAPTGAGESGKSETIYTYGGIANTAITNEIQDATFAAETTRRVQFRWRWRVAELTDANAATYFDPAGTKGLADAAGDPNTAIDAQGGAGAPVASRPFTRSDVRQTAGTFPFADTGLYVAGNGDATDAASFKSLDGYVYGLPVCGVLRTAGDPNIPTGTDKSDVSVNTGSASTISDTLEARDTLLVGTNAANKWESVGGAIGSPVLLQVRAASTDANVDVRVVPKGTGALRTTKLRAENDGTTGAVAYGWQNETDNNTGLIRTGEGAFAAVANGTKVADFAATGAAVTGTLASTGVLTGSGGVVTKVFAGALTDANTGVTTANALVWRTTDSKLYMRTGVDTYAVVGVTDHTLLTNIGSNSHSTIDTHLDATVTHGATGAVVGTTNVQTLTLPTIGDFTNATHGHANPAGGGTVSYANLVSRTHTLSGADHTASGLTAGQVIRASGATTFAWAALGHGDLGSVTADQHHAQAHTLSGADHTGQLSHGSLASIGANDHHPQSHTLATNVGLGADHTISGATAGYVLRASAATAAAFAQLGHGDLGSVTADQHHAQSHVLATNTGLGADHTISGATAGYVLRASAATAAAFAQLAHTDLTAASIGSNSHATIDTHLAAASPHSSHVVGAYIAGNATGNVPISNGTINTNLNADMVDGSHASAFATSGHNHDATYAPRYLALSTKTGAYPLTVSDGVILADATTAGFTLTLPTAVGITGKVFDLKKIDSSANVVTVATTASQTIDGSSTLSISVQWDSFTVVSNGANWSII